MANCHSLSGILVVLQCLFIYLCHNQLITSWESTTFGDMDPYAVTQSCLISIGVDTNNYPIVYSFGGKRKSLFSESVDNAIFKWTPSTDDKLREITTITTPSPFTCGQNVAYHINSNLIYITGMSQSPSVYGLFYIFNPNTDTFQTSTIPTMSNPVRSNCIVMDNHNDLLYIVGCINSLGNTVNTLQILNMLSLTWNVQNNITTLPINIASSSCWLSSDSSRLYTFGGATSISPQIIISDAIYR